MESFLFAINIFTNCDYLFYHEFVTGVASFALNILNGKKTANMQPLKVTFEFSKSEDETVIVGRT